MSLDTLAVLGSDWYYTQSEITALSSDLKSDVLLLIADVGRAPGKVSAADIAGIQAFAHEVQDYLDSRPVSALDPSSWKTVGDQLVKYRERASDWRYRLKAASVPVSPTAPPPAQRRRDDPRDLEDERRKAAEWGWKQYILVAALGLGAFAIVGVVVAPVLVGALARR